MISFATGAKALCVVLMAILAGTTSVAAQSAQNPVSAARDDLYFHQLQQHPGASRGARRRSVASQTSMAGSRSICSSAPSAPPRRSSRRIIDVLTTLLPLQVGKAVHLTRAGPADKGWQANVAVEKYETVEVPVGRLNCFVLLWTEPSGQGRWERRWWYCPSLEYVAKYSAKFEVVSPGGRILTSSPTSWELAGVRVP